MQFRCTLTHSLTAALDQLRVVASSTSNDPGPRSRQHQQIGQRLTVKIVMSNFEYVKYSSLLNTLKGNCFDDEQYVYYTNSRGTKARSCSWSCCSGLKNLILFTSLRIVWYVGTSSSAAADRPRDALCPSVVILDKIITRADTTLATSVINSPWCVAAKCIVPAAGTLHSMQ